MTTSNFVRDEEGSVTFFVLVLSVGLMAMMGLVMDTGRTFAAHSQVQAYVDNVAMAMARELDGKAELRDDDGNLIRAGAIDRAKAIMGAAGDLSAAAVTKASTMTGTSLGNGSSDFAIYEPIFLTGQPKTFGSTITDASLTDANGNSLVTANDAEASHVLIIGKTEEVPWTFFNLASLVTGAGGANVGSSDGVGGAFSVESWAVAELVTNETVIDDRLMICGGPAFENLVKGQQLVLDKSRGGDWSEGTYGAIATVSDDADGTCGNAGYTEGSAQWTACTLGLDNPTPTLGNYTADAIGDVAANSPAQQDFNAGLNARFGIISDELSALRGDANISSDKNTITGNVYTCTGADLDVKSESAQLPVDQCFIEGTCTTVSNGPINPELIQDYCDFTHGQNDNYTGDCPLDANGNPPSTLYSIYLAEIAAEASGFLDPNGNEGANTCQTDANANAENRANRRVIEVAIADCSGISEGDITPTDVPITAYAEVFLAQPVQQNEFFTIDFDSWTQEDGTVVQMVEGDVPSMDPEYEGTNKYTGDAGYNRFDPYISMGVTITGISGRNGGAESMSHAPMLFNTTQYSGDDDDLTAAGFGNVLIMSENGDDRLPDERSSLHGDGPDDDGQGGTIVFRFAQPAGVTIYSLDAFDTDGGGAVRLYDEQLTDAQLASLNLDDGSSRKVSNDEEHDYRAYSDDEMKDVSDDVLNELGWVWTGSGSEKVFTQRGAKYAKAPSKLGDGSYEPMDLKATSGVKMLVYTFENDSGGIDNLRFSGENVPMFEHDRITAEFLSYITEGDGRAATYTHLSN
ncbi:MAG: Tad domain-containing protein [Pseudomonadota bacterium]